MANKFEHKQPVKRNLESSLLGSGIKPDPLQFGDTMLLATTGVTSKDIRVGYRAIKMKTQDYVCAVKPPLKNYVTELTNNYSF